MPDESDSVTDRSAEIRAKGKGRAMDKKVYLGDGVYAEYDGFGVWLTTELANGEHRIYLEMPMIESLTEVMAAWQKSAR